MLLFSLILLFTFFIYTCLASDSKDKKVDIGSAKSKDLTAETSAKVKAVNAELKMLCDKVTHAGYDFKGVADIQETVDTPIPEFKTEKQAENYIEGVVGEKKHLEDYVSKLIYELLANLKALSHADAKNVITDIKMKEDLPKVLEEFKKIEKVTDPFDKLAGLAALTKNQTSFLTELWKAFNVDSLKLINEIKSHASFGGLDPDDKKFIEDHSSKGMNTLPNDAERKMVPIHELKLHMPKWRLEKYEKIKVIQAKLGIKGPASGSSSEPEKKTFESKEPKGSSIKKDLIDKSSKSTLASKTTSTKDSPTVHKSIKPDTKTKVEIEKPVSGDRKESSTVSTVKDDGKSSSSSGGDKSALDIKKSVSLSSESTDSGHVGTTSKDKPDTLKSPVKTASTTTSPKPKSVSTATATKDPIKTSSVDVSPSTSSDSVKHSLPTTKPTTVSKTSSLSQGSSASSASVATVGKRDSKVKSSNVSKSKTSQPLSSTSTDIRYTVEEATDTQSTKEDPTGSLKKSSTGSMNSDVSEDTYETKDANDMVVAGSTFETIRPGQPKLQAKIASKNEKIEQNWPWLMILLIAGGSVVVLGIVILLVWKLGFAKSSSDVTRAELGLAAISQQLKDKEKRAF